MLPVSRAAAFAAAALIVAGAAPLRAQERSIDIEAMDARVVVARTGRVHVTERFTVRFNGQWNGIYRSIPVEYRTPQGLNYTLRLRLEGATDDAGTSLEVESERAGRDRRFRIWVPGAHDATRTVVLSYTVDNALRFFEEHDELYWNVTGDQWDFPIRQVTAEVMLPDDVTGVRTASFTGAHGATESAIVEQVGSTVRVRGTRPLGFREDLTLVVGWNPGTVHRPTAAEKVRSTLASNSILILPVFVFFGMFGLWRRYGRDPDPGSIYVRYEPPPGLTPAEAGTLIDDRADVRDITATLVDLAVRGFVSIEETKQEQLFGLLSSRDYELTLLHAGQWPSLKPHERALLQALSVHSHDDRVMVSELQNQFYKHLPQIRKHLTRTLVDGGFYVSHPDVIRVIWFVIAGVVLALTIALGAAAYERLGMSSGAVIVAGIASGLAIAVFGWFMPRRTHEGARMHAWLRGFQEFLCRVERDRLQRMSHSPDTFEKLLPYAMAFGVEKNWARAFDGLASQPPTWYHSSDGRPFRPNLFVADLGRMTAATGSAMTTAPRSSSSGSSGFSGGSSGGGFGGGGGGGF